MKLRFPTMFRPTSETIGVSVGGFAGQGSMYFEIKPELGVAFIDMYRLGDLPRLTLGFASLLAHPDFRPSFHMCVDVRSLRDYPTAEQLTVLAAKIRAFGPTWLTGRLALVARTSEDCAVAYSFVAQLGAGMSVRTRVVDDIVGALEWFEVPHTRSDVPHSG